MAERLVRDCGNCGHQGVKILYDEEGTPITATLICPLTLLNGIEMSAPVTSDAYGNLGEGVIEQMNISSPNCNYIGLSALQIATLYRVAGVHGHSELDTDLTVDGTPQFTGDGGNRQRGVQDDPKSYVEYVAPNNEFTGADQADGGDSESSLEAQSGHKQLLDYLINGKCVLLSDVRFSEEPVEDSKWEEVKLTFTLSAENFATLAKPGAELAFADDAQTFPTVEIDGQLRATFKFDPFSDDERYIVTQNDVCRLPYGDGTISLQMVKVFYNGPDGKLCQAHYMLQSNKID